MSRTLALIASLFMGSCALNEPNNADLDQELMSPNGVSANGIAPTLISPEGPDQRKIRLEGVRPSGRLNGQPISIAASGPPLSGPGVVGSIWLANVSDGTTVELRIDAAVAGATDLWSYQLSVKFEETWRPLCSGEGGSAGFADSVRGSWKLGEGVVGGGAYHPATSEFTIACRGSAIAKCVELGYTPWAGRAAELASCVRALRGDYCGDGTPYTANGTIVNIYDQSGTVPDDLDWVPEAEWTPAGARCISKKKEARFSQLGLPRPSCVPSKLKSHPSCGSGFDSGAAIITELTPP